MVNLGTEFGKVMIKEARRACAGQTLPQNSHTEPQGQMHCSAAGNAHDFNGDMPAFLQHLDSLVLVLKMAAKMRDWQKSASDLKKKMHAFAQNVLSVVEVCGFACVGGKSGVDSDLFPRVIRENQ